MTNSIESLSTTVFAAAANARASFAAVSLDRAAARIRAFEFLDDPATAGLRAVKLGGGPDHRTAQLPPTQTSRSLFSSIRNLFGDLIGGLFLFIYFFSDSFKSTNFANTSTNGPDTTERCICIYSCFNLLQLNDIKLILITN